MDSRTKQNLSPCPMCGGGVNHGDWNLLPSAYKGPLPKEVKSHTTAAIIWAVNFETNYTTP